MSIEIQQTPVCDLIPYVNNARTHSEGQVAQIASSIKEFGFNNPILIDEDNGIIAGHGRLLAARVLDIAEVPTVCLDHLSEPQRKAYIIADNKLALNAGWDDELLKLELLEIEDNIDLDVIGFSDEEIAELFGPDETEGLTDDDAVPELQDDTVSKRGDVWLLGSHRVMCGDSTSVDDVEKLMGGKKADMVFTSPPYNANTKAGEGDIFNGKKSKKLYAEGYSDNLQADEYVKFAQDVLALCFAFTEGFIFWNVSYNKNSRYQYIKQITPWLEYLREQICWKKSSTIPFKGSLMRDWEPIYLFSTMKANLGLDKVTSNFWEVSNTGSQAENHKACYPVALVEKGIGIIEGAKILLDPFLGSGSTLIAAEKTGRICYGMELDEKYCDVIVRRWQDFTGNDSTLESTGELFNTLQKKAA